jgi:hypothetical protein
MITVFLIPTPYRFPAGIGPYAFTWVPDLVFVLLLFMYKWYSNLKNKVHGNSKEEMAV